MNTPRDNVLPEAEQPHCLQRQADLYAAADEMGEWAATHPLAPARTFAEGEGA